MGRHVGMRTIVVVYRGKDRTGCGECRSPTLTATGSHCAQTLCAGTYCPRVPVTHLKLGRGRGPWSATGGVRVAVEHAGTRHLIVWGLWGALGAGTCLVRAEGLGEVRAVVSLVRGVAAVVRFVVAVVSRAFGGYGGIVRGWRMGGVPGMS